MGTVSKRSLSRSSCIKKNKEVEVGSKEGIFFFFNVGEIAVFYANWNYAVEEQKDNEVEQLIARVISLSRQAGMGFSAQWGGTASWHTKFIWENKREYR